MRFSKNFLAHIVYHNLNCNLYLSNEDQALSISKCIFDNVAYEPSLDPIALDHDTFAHPFDMSIM